MNPEVKEKWVAALRSGDYRQGKNKLARKMTSTMPMTHCCLGVLCELAVAEGLIEAKNEKQGISGTVRYFGDEREWASTALPGVVADWAGFVNTPKSLKSNPALYSVPDENSPDPEAISYVDCAEANDGYDYRGVKAHTFGEIADLIEANF